MTALYPLKFRPQFKDYLWGGNKLKQVFGKPVEGETAAESWEISAVEGNISVVAEGTLEGSNLQELIDLYGERLMGEQVIARFGNNFPVLIKFIDARKDLSIQLHPNDALAKERHNSFGKTEMWYIMQADQGAELIVGFEETVDKEVYLEKLAQNALLEILHKEPVKAGDTFFINTGKVHAIGAGILLAEIQQTSNITYRIYDYNRKDKDGKERELHTDLALDALDYERKDDFRVEYDRETLNRPSNMVKSPYFITNFINVHGLYEKQLINRDSFTIYICTEGNVRVKASDWEGTLKAGESLLVPAELPGIQFSAAAAKILEVHL